MTTGKIIIPRPGQGITPAAFWSEWLPPVLTEFAEVIKEHAGPLKAVLSVRVTGEGGGDWSVRVEGGEVEIVSGLLEEATVTLELSTQDFVDAVTGKNDELLPWESGLSGELDPREIGESIRRAAAMLEQIKGSMEFRAEDPEGSFVVLLKFQGKPKDKPDTVVAIDKSELREMKATGLSMVQAFMTGKIRVKGLMDLVLKFAPLVT